MREEHEGNENRNQKYLACIQMGNLLNTPEQQLTLNEFIQKIPEIVKKEKSMFTMIVNALHIGNMQVKNVNPHYITCLVVFWRERMNKYATDQVN